jgi:hypothetical protein
LCLFLWWKSTRTSWLGIIGCCWRAARRSSWPTAQTVCPRYAYVGADRQAHLGAHAHTDREREVDASTLLHAYTQTQTSRPVHVWADPEAAHAQAMLERVTHIFGCAPSAAAPLRWPAWLADLPIAAPFLDPDYIFSILTGAREDDARAAHLLARTVAAGPHAPAGRLRLPR